LTGPGSAAGPAGSNFVLAALCLLEFAGVFPRFSGTLMAIQFLVIHSSAFIFTLPFWDIKESAKPVAFKVLLGLYTLLAFSIDGFFGIAQFAGLTYATYYGYVLGKDGETGRVPLLLRWLVSFIVFLLAIGITDAPSDVDSWAGSRRLALTGALFFGAAGLMELSGFYGEGWRRLLRRAASRQPQLLSPMPAWVARELDPQGTPPPPGGDVRH